MSGDSIYWQIRGRTETLNVSRINVISSALCVALRYNGYYNITMYILITRPLLMRILAMGAKMNKYYLVEIV